MLRGIVIVAIAGALLAPRAAEAGAVVVFPLDARGVARETADAATDKLEATLRSLKAFEVIETAAVEKKLGVQLTEQARACEYDVFCLVEVGELLQSERMIIGHVKKAARSETDELELKLFVLDVAKASVVDVLVWKVPGGASSLADAVQAAGRRLFSKPDGKLVLELRPPNAEVSFYGDPVPRTLGGPLDWWSGVYQARVQAEGYQPQTLRIVVHPGSATKVPIELQPDLLYVPKKDKKVTPFAQGSRREGGSGVSAEDAGAIEEARPDEGPVKRRSAFANPLAWSVTGVGVAASVVGSILANGAQSDYNTLSRQERYLPGVTLSAAQAMQSREDARSQFQTGSIIAISGAVVAVGGLVWMIIDSTTASPGAKTASIGGAGASSGAGPTALGEWHF